MKYYFYNNNLFRLVPRVLTKRLGPGYHLRKIKKMYSLFGAQFVGVSLICSYDNSIL